MQPTLQPSRSWSMATLVPAVRRRTRACSRYALSPTATLDECKCGWPKESHGRRRHCRVCEHSWLDVYNMDECPKCCTRLSEPVKCLPGEASSHRQSPLSAIPSSSGDCPKGGPHRWRFGRCTECWMCQGDELKQLKVETAEKKSTAPLLRR